MRKLLLLVTALSLLPLAGAQSTKKGDWLAFIGTYTRGKSKGIYTHRFSPATGAFTEVGLAVETPNPSFLAIHPNNKFLYAVNEVSDYEGKSAGSISAFSIDPATGKLKLLNVVSSKGSGPCHLALDHKGKWLIAANYGGGSVAVFPVHDDGSLGEASSFVQHTGKGATDRQSRPHAHYATVTPDNKLVMIADLGLDKILIYDLDAVKGTITPHNPPSGSTAPGTGPRHAAFRPDGKFLYVMNELVPSVTAFRFDPSKGSLDEVQSLSTLPVQFEQGMSGAEIVAHPSGKFLYASNRGHNSIAAFSIASDGKLTAAGNFPTEGRTPRSFAVDPTGNLLFAANQDTDNIVLFKIDQKTGALTAAGKTLDVGVPVCVVFAPAR